MERKLSTIQKILELQPIENADAIEVAVVNGWKVVIKKGEYAAGDKVIYCEIDSFLPIREEYEFLRKSSWKKMGDQEGFRLRTVKLRGQISQGLLLPVSLLPGVEPEIGTDVTEALGIVKYEPPIPAQLAGMMKGYFPSFVHKTDEERIQNLVEEYEQYKSHKLYVTEKLDGSSVTYYWNAGEFGVCSRNIDLKETTENSLWKVARSLDIESKMSTVGHNIALQGELLGEGIQGNHYKIRGQTVRFFSAFNIDTQEYLPLRDMQAMMHRFNLHTVPVLDEDFTLPDTVDALLLFANGKSALNPAADREGIVVRSWDKSVSFKAISNNWLLKYE